MSQPYSYFYFFLLILIAASTSAIPVQHASDLSGEQQITDRPEITPSLEHASFEHHGIITYDDDDDNDNTKNTITPRGTTDSDLPIPFDTSLGTNYTRKSCPKFFTKFLSDSSLQSCHALSLLLRNSNSFFYILHSTTATSHLLDVACSASVSQCTSTLSSLAKELIKDDNCGEEYKLGNPNVVDAYIDLVSYEPLYHASCLKNPSTDNYCFVDAVTNSTNSADYDVYFVPYGNALDDQNEASWDNNTPTCNRCLRETMGVYKGFARVDGQPLVKSYLPSARVVDRHCGGGFADLNVTVGAVKKVEKSGALTLGSGTGLGWIVAGVLTLALWG